MLSRLMAASIFILSALLGVFALHPGTVRAEPYLAIRTGFKCIQCHVNHTGGGKRTDFGVIYSQTNLNMNLLPRADRTMLLDNHLNESVSIGANFRTSESFVFAFENDQGTKGDDARSSSITEANLYIEVELVPNKAALYIDQTMAPSAGNREMFAIIEDLPHDSYLKVGRMLLPYGLRLVDDGAFVRSRTGYTYNRHAIGIEIGLEPGPTTFVANLTDDQLSVVGSAVFRRFMFGGSLGRTTVEGGKLTGGPFAGVNFGRFTLLGEADVIDTGNIDQLAGIAELNFLAMQGLNVKATYEYFDRDTNISREFDAQERITFGAEPFLTQFVQLRTFYRINNFIPQNVSQNQDELLVEFHVFF